VQKPEYPPHPACLTSKTVVRQPGAVSFAPSYNTLELPTAYPAGKFFLSGTVISCFFAFFSGSRVHPFRADGKNPQFQVKFGTQ
jgi:hypothetical protein